MRVYMQVAIREKVAISSLCVLCSLWSAPPRRTGLRRNRESVSALLARAYTTTLLGMGGVRASPTLTMLGLIYHHDGMYARKVIARPPPTTHHPPPT